MLQSNSAVGLGARKHRSLRGLLEDDPAKAQQHQLVLAHGIASGMAFLGWGAEGFRKPSSRRMS